MSGTFFESRPDRRLASLDGIVHSLHTVMYSPASGFYLYLYLYLFVICFIFFLFLPFHIPVLQTTQSIVRICLGSWLFFPVLARDQLQYCIRAGTLWSDHMYDDTSLTRFEWVELNLLNLLNLLN